ncbi:MULTISPECIES: bifunctional diguanylate cyclase/phosphodiesterase [Pacificimonas]|nr:MULTISPECIES: EAL domain-containing protein [Pacificimonas]MBZ6377213.1 EAL domain-containing protein [Pacificimonas aurantium]
MEKPFEHAARASFRLLATAPEEPLSAITRVAATLFGVEGAVILLRGDDELIRKAAIGEVPGDFPKPFPAVERVIEDGRVLQSGAEDPVLGDLVTGFFAGGPLSHGRETTLGALCLFDRAERPALSSDELSLLKGLAGLATEMLLALEDREAARIAALINDTASDAVVLTDDEGCIIGWNPAAEHMFGFPAEDIMGEPLHRIIPEAEQADAELSREELAKLAASSAEGVCELRGIRKSGEEFPVEASIASWRSREDRHPVGFALIMRDTSERKKLLADRNRSRQFLSIIFENVPSMVFVKNARTRRFEFVNRGAEEMLGIGRDKIVGRTDADLFGVPGSAAVQQDDLVVRTGEPVVSEFDFEKPDGDKRRIRTKRVLFRDLDGAEYILGISEDITLRHRAQEELARKGMQDPLTGMRNRMGLQEDFDAIVRRPDSHAVAMVAINLDRFKSINERHGATVGDDLLCHVANRILALLPQGYRAARTGGDEFAVLIRGRYAEQRAERISAAILQTLERPFDLGDESVRLGASLGIAVSENGDRPMQQLLADAEHAVRRAKGEGGGRFFFFDKQLGAEIRLLRQLEADLPAAIEHDQIDIYYQPVLRLSNNEVAGFEALARWCHPAQGQVSPAKFISIAEETGLIVELGEKVMRKGMREAASWHSSTWLSVNLSPVQLGEAGFCDRLKEVMASSGFDPGCLVLEITENTLIRESAAEVARELFREMRDLGVRFALDDFGTGYSSLSTFRRYPFDNIKIDKSFVRDMLTSPEARAIVQAVIGLGRGLGLKVVAEGVETEGQLEALRDDGCEYAQGFLIGRPAPRSAFGDLSRPFFLGDLASRANG